MPYYHKKYTEEENSSAAASSLYNSCMPNPNMSGMDSEHMIPLRTLLSVIHTHTEKLKIRVVGDSESIADNSKLTFLTENATKSQNEIDRVLKYYGDVPVWNLHVEMEPVYHYEIANQAKGQYIRGILVANCYYKACKPGYLLEKADIRHEKTRTRNQKRRAKE